MKPSRDRWARLETLADVLGVFLAAAALVVALAANNLAHTANSLAHDANEVAHDVAQRHEITESFPACVWEVTGSVEVREDGSWGDTTGGSAMYRVVTNTGRLPVMLVGASGDFGSRMHRQEVLLERLRLGDDDATARTDAVYLQPGQAAAVRLSWDIPTETASNELPRVTLIFADGSGESLDLHTVNGGGGLPTSVRTLYSSLGADSESLSTCSL